MSRIVDKNSKNLPIYDKKNFKNELKHSKYLDHVTDDVMSLCWSRKIISKNITFPQIFSAEW